MKEAVSRWFTAVMFVSQISLAAEFSEPMRVIGIDVGDQNALYLRMSARTECGSPIVFIGREQPHYKDVFEIALLAYSAGKEVRVSVSSCDFQRRGAIARIAVGTP